MIETYQALLIAGFTGVVTGLMQWAAMRVDISWIKRILHSHDKRLTSIEEKI